MGNRGIHLHHIKKIATLVSSPHLIYMTIKNILLAFSILLGNLANAQQSAIRNNYKDETGLTRLKIERRIIYIPGNTWLYNHHAAIIKFKGKLIATWSSGLIDEDSPGQRVVFSVSNDFVHWSAPAIVAEPSIAANGIKKKCLRRQVFTNTTAPW